MILIEPQETESTIQINESEDYLLQIVGHNEDQQTLRLNFEHSKPNTTANISIKTVLYDSAKFDVEAKLIINKGAYGTDSFLKIDCLLIGDKARARAVPSLEIEEDDVKAGHGATVGRLDELQIYYMTSRGINPSLAESELVKAFLAKE